MREFSADYLERTREGMWESREALSDLELDTRKRVLDVGCGTGELSRVLAEETAGEVVGTDADPRLLAVAGEHVPVVAGDAHRLPFPDDSFDLVVCQALLINLPDPERAVREFARISSDLVAAIEPDNSAVSVESTVSVEGNLSRRAREAYVDGVDTNVALGGDGTRNAFSNVGVSDVSTLKHHHSKTVAPPYSARDLEAAKKKATANALDERRETLTSSLTADEYERLRVEWREMGRSAIEQMQADEYRRAEVVPFYVTTGRV
ncbi:class I SAM-dependent methyltransferase [Haladaptatus cibarius]|uniref:class I SAM-dependent methyltransferase n=1 Tax=Haladaptatus cibarius TaxID=453847 RepID=UPI000679139F|nr:class I SAM-dependent methyltransferase [Haladaptatus cibarius]